MKTIFLISIYIASFMLFYLMLSLLAMVFMPYQEAISDREWFVIYTLFIGWWVAAFPALEYRRCNEEYFNKYTGF